MRKSEAIQWIRERYDRDTYYDNKFEFMEEMNQLINVYLYLSNNSTETEKMEYNENYNRTGAQEQLIYMARWCCEYYNTYYLTKEDLIKKHNLK